LDIKRIETNHFQWETDRKQHKEDGYRPKIQLPSVEGEQQ